MRAEELINIWFEKWGSGEYRSLPIAEDFRHISPFGIIVGRNNYMDMIRANEDKFLGYTFLLQEGIYENDRAVVRYTCAQASGFKLEVSEWFYTRGSLIQQVISYYHIGEIRHDRQLQETER